MTTSPSEISKTPRANDWNRFWQGQNVQKIKEPSWSKKRILSILEPFSIKGKKALDAGCGSGFFSKYFCERGMNVVALDHSDQSLEMTRQMTGGRALTVKADLLSGEISQMLGSQFDLIFTDGLLEHFSAPDQDKIMKNFLALLTDGGVVVTVVPNRWSPWEIIRPIYMPGIWEKPFVMSGLVELNQRQGFEIIQKGGLNTFPFAFSPDKVFGEKFGMLLYTISKKYVH